jgi:hypothetical protein
MSKPILSKQSCQIWIKALRSGNFIQGHERLKCGNQHGTRHCCLGVLHDVTGYPVDRYHESVVEGPSLPSHKTGTLIKFNDGGKSFDMISNHIERYILPYCPEKKVDKKKVF